MDTESEPTFAIDALCRAIVEQATDAIIFADRGGTIRLWNRGAELIFGYPPAEAVGQSLDIIIPDRLREAHWNGFHRAIESDQTKYDNRVMTTRSMHKNGSKLYVDLSFVLIKDHAGIVQGALAIGRDCTARYLSHLAASQGPSQPGGHQGGRAA